MLLVKVGVLVVRNVAFSIVATVCVSTVVFGDVNCLRNCGVMCD